MSIISSIIYSYMNLVPYWNNKNIHNLGNTGALGNLHAMTAPLMTRFIDRTVYGGRNVREEVYNSLDGSVLDMCCGTGFSTKPGSVGIDTSLEMLRFSKLFNPGSDYRYGNAETFGSNEEFDTVSIMFSFHEMPMDAHRNIIRNAIRVARKKVVLVDISRDYKPTTAMLSGEPYLLNYLDTFQSTIDNIIWKEETDEAFPIFHLLRWNKTTLVDKHVDMWEYNKPSKYTPLEMPREEARSSSRSGMRWRRKRVLKRVKRMKLKEKRMPMVYRFKATKFYSARRETSKRAKRNLKEKKRKDKFKRRKFLSNNDDLKERRAKAWEYFMGGDIEDY